MDKTEQIRAIAEHYGLTRNSDFARFFEVSEQTADRSLTPAELREYFSAPCSPSRAYYRDILLLSFLLCGINLEDLIAVRSLRGGRIETVRIKTGQPISIGVPPEALAHSTAKSVTSIYIRVDMRKKIDAANRAVIDHIFGGSLLF